MTQFNISQRLGKTTKTINRAIVSLKEKEIVERIGSDRKGYWKIK